MSDRPGSAQESTRRTGFRLFMTQAIAVNPAPGSGRVAVRAAITMLVALSTLLAVGRFQWSLYATFGAFASVYGGRMPRRGRWRLQLVMGVVLVTATTVGALVATSPHREWIAVSVAAGAAALAASASIHWRWTPPGPLFVTFAVAACASIPTTARTVAMALAVAAATAVLAVVLGLVEEQAMPWRGPALAPPASPAIDPLRHAVRSAVAVALAGSVSTIVGVGHPYWAMVAAVVPMSGASVTGQVTRGVQRSVGTFIGLLPAWLVLALHLPSLVLVVLIAAMQGVIELLVGRNYAAALVFVTPLALTVGHLAHPTPVGGLLVDRLVETALGAVLGSAVAIILRDRRLAGASS